MASSSEAPRLDTHAKPPEHLKSAYKTYQRNTNLDFDGDTNVFDASSGCLAGFVEAIEAIQSLHMPQDLMEIVKTFLDGHEHDSQVAESSLICYEHPDLPGLLVFPALFSPTVQMSLLTRLLHRDVSNPTHRNNLALHYSIPYPTASTGAPVSFFEPSSRNLSLTPLDPTQHKPITIPSMLDKKLRWITLGGQYDWTAKRYPTTTPPPFPPDIAALIHGIFPTIAPQAAILNFYSPGHTLSLHRDASEACDRPLVSVSLGCDGLFMAGLDGGGPAATLRLRSGDVVVMAGAARYAWHGVPKILAGTCPEWLASWPVVAGDADSEERYAEYKGWMAGKRINLNVRQMSE